MLTLHTLQLSNNQSKFDVGYQLFKKKWSDYKEFLEYCDKEWINSKNLQNSSDAYWFDALAYAQKKPFLKYSKTCDIYLLTLDKLVDLEQYLDNLECDGDCLNVSKFLI